VLLKGSPKHNWLNTLAILLLACVLAGLPFNPKNEVTAYGFRSEEPERKALITVSYTSYEWWLLTWSNSNVICQVFVEHEGLPQPGEVQYYCGTQVMNDWLATSPCTFSDEITKADQCPGFYFHLARMTPGEREIEVDLLPPEVFLDIAGCTPRPPGYYCDSAPELRLIGEEPLPNESIINIQGYLGAEPFNCQGSVCTVPLPATGVNGTQAVFWAESSFGDASETYTAQVRVIPWGDFTAPDVQTEDQPQWYVDILSSQYMGENQSTCSQIWSAFPPVGGPPLWLSSPNHPDALISTQPYYHLAGTLIDEGLVDISRCSDGGLESFGYASQCGLEAARPLINEWQNQFNAEIIQVSQDTGVPSQLMKNIFSRESQFWPGLAPNQLEAGLGHLSDQGADTVLLWNPSFFSQFCPLILDSSRCQSGFGNLDIAEQEMLRGALVQKVNAACPECPQGIDLRQANFSISIFARSLLANCEQVGQIIYNRTLLSAGEVSNYEDLWRFTLINYNAGPGCLNSAIKLAVDNNYPLTWDSVIQFLEPGGCQACIGYVDDIARMPGLSAATPTPTPQEIAPTQIPTNPPDTDFDEPVQITPTPTEEAYPVIEPPDDDGYPYP